MNEKEPLAFRMRPKTLEEYVGQEHVIGPGKLLYRTIKADRLSSIILFGPPGCGKTSLAKVISETTKYKFYKINAVTAGVADIKRVVEETRNYMMNPTGKSILFIDEIHRFNKLQQDDKYEEVKEALNVGEYNMIVTPKEIDDLIENMKDIVARGINFAI